jgi:hypothetical protein
MIATDVNVWDHQSAILNVHTADLKFWGGTNDGHYDLGYRYDFPDNTVGIADEWNHANTNGVNPFGFHPSVPQGDAYQAVHDSASQHIVW